MSWAGLSHSKMHRQQRPIAAFSAYRLHLWLRWYAILTVFSGSCQRKLPILFGPLQAPSKTGTSFFLCPTCLSLGQCKFISPKGLCFSNLACPTLGEGERWRQYLRISDFKTTIPQWRSSNSYSEHLIGVLVSVASAQDHTASCSIVKPRTEPQVNKPWVTSIQVNKIRCLLRTLPRLFSPSAGTCNARPAGLQLSQGQAWGGAGQSGPLTCYQIQRQCSQPAALCVKG